MTTRVQRGSSRLAKAQMYLILGSLVATGIAGDLLARREMKTAVPTETAVVVFEERRPIPQVVTQGRSSR